MVWWPLTLYNESKQKKVGNKLKPGIKLEYIYGKHAGSLIVRKGSSRNYVTKLVLLRKNTLTKR